MNEHFVYTVDELAELLRIGRTSAYVLVNSGQIQSVRVGRAIRIPANALARFLAGDARETDEGNA